MDKRKRKKSYEPFQFGKMYEISDSKEFVKLLRKEREKAEIQMGKIKGVDEILDTFYYMPRMDDLNPTAWHKSYLNTAKSSLKALLVERMPKKDGNEQYNNGVDDCIAVIEEVFGAD